MPLRTPLACLLLAVAASSCSKKEEAPAAPPKAPEKVAAAPVAPTPPPAAVVQPPPPAAKPDTSGLEEAYQKSLERDVAAHPELRNLAAVAGRYRSRHLEEFVLLQQPVLQWIAATDSGPRREATERVTAFCETMAEIRTATDPSLVKLLHTDAAAQEKDLTAKTAALGVTATGPADGSSPEETLGACYDALGTALQDWIRTGKLPKNLFNQEYLDLQMESFIGKKFGDALDSKASPETRALRAKLQAAGVN
ncbi:MAG: hypothetical protein JWO82_2578 [Akkermansiaceae bacterium]|nr:hypothetical protein [Akkermansiaceae bacterium]